MVRAIEKAEDDIFEPDLLCMQETGISNWMMGGGDLLDYFSANLKYKYGSYGASQVAPAGFNVMLLSKIPFKKVTRYSLPNPTYQSNMVVVEIDGKWFNINNDVVIACAHLATGNEKSDQVFSITEIAKKATDEGKSALIVADWNIDIHTRCQLECENNWNVCVDLLNSTYNANLREIFWEIENNGSSTTNLNNYNNINIMNEYGLLRTDGLMDKLLDYAFINEYITNIKSIDIVDYESCLDKCCYDIGITNELLVNDTNENCCRIDDNDEVKDVCKWCRSPECDTCSPSDHLPVFIEVGWD